MNRSALLSLAAVALVAMVPLCQAVPRASSPHSEELGDVVAVRRWTFRGQPQVAHLHRNEPTICDSVKQYSGYFNFGSSDKKYFYWFFESRNDPKSDPLVMWLTGGPGCSSMLALLAENGPCGVDAKGATTFKNKYSWNTKANLLYVDQPPGTGFSGGSYDHDETGVAEDMYNFLQAFFTGYEQYNSTFYIFGESYAGHYVPAISHRVFKGNQNKEAGHIPLAGAAIGNGLTDPEIQYDYYAKMGYNSTSAPSVISKTTYNVMRAAAPACIAAIKSCQSSSAACILAFTICNLAEVTPVQSTGINPYDMRIKCEHGNLCYDFTRVDTYLNRADVQKEIGVSKKWESCNMAVNMLFRGDWMHNYQNQLPDLLENGIRVLIYAGDQDFICNWLGNKAWTLALEWDGKDDFNSAKDTAWKVDGKEAGMIRTASNFTFLQVYQAGHMVPMDQPAVALKMLDDFIAA